MIAYQELYPTGNYYNQSIWRVQKVLQFSDTLLAPTVWGFATDNTEAPSMHFCHVCYICWGYDFCGYGWLWYYWITLWEFWHWMKIWLPINYLRCHLFFCCVLCLFYCSLDFLCLFVCLFVFWVLFVCLFCTTNLLHLSPVPHLLLRCDASSFLCLEKAHPQLFFSASGYIQ